MSLIPLHVYSGYSLLKSGLKVLDYVKEAKKRSLQFVGLSDYQNLSGIPSLVKECKANSITPIVGEDLDLEGIVLTFIVKNEEGYHNLLKLNLEAQAKRLSLPLVKENNSGLSVILSVQNDIIKEAFLKSKEEFAKRMAKFSSDIKDFYFGIEVNNEVEYIKEIREFAFSHGYQTVAFPFVKYLKKEDAIILEMMTCIETKEILDHRSLEGNEYLLEDKEIEKLYLKEEIENTEKIAKEVNFNFIEPRGKMLVYQNDLGLTSDEYLKKLAFEGLEKRGKVDKVYIDRINFELDVIKSMGYSDYFLIVYDYVKFAKDNDIAVGPGRGSASGSLVSYALGITVADPIEYNLLFERFLNPYRQTMPDIDVDFSDIQRDEIVNYLAEKYGKDRVAKIIAIQKIGAKQALRDVGRIFNYSKNDIELFTKLITDDDEDKLSLREIYKQNPKFRDLYNDDEFYANIVKLAAKIEGLPRQDSLHAVGIVLNAEPLLDAIPLSLGPDGEFVEQFEKDHLEEQGFLKMDILALRNLTIIDDCLALLKQKGIVINRDEIPYDDELAIKQIASAKTMGLFQLESKGIRRAIKELKPSSFEDIVALLALYRPGPMQNIPTYASRKEGRAKIPYISKALEDILAPTYGIIVYQEQVMQIANKMAGFSLGEADTFRRAISKKDATKIEKMRVSFIEGSIKNGYAEKEATEVFDHIAKFGDYGFNRSHSLVYAIFSLRMAYLKSHYPEEFYASILANTGSDKFETTLAEMRESKIKVLNPDINKSGFTFQLENGNILFPLVAVKGIMYASAKSIIEERMVKPFEDIFDFVLRMRKYRFNNNQLINLIDAGAFDSIEKSRSSLRVNIPKAMTYADLVEDDEGQIVIDIGIYAKPIFDRVEDNYIDNLNREYNVLGMMVSGSPLDTAKDKIKKLGAIQLDKIALSKGTIKTVVLIKRVKNIRTKKNLPMAFISVFDETAEIDMTVFTDAYEKSSLAIKPNTIVCITGYYSSNKQEFNVQLVEKLEDIANE